MFENDAWKKDYKIDKNKMMMIQFADYRENYSLTLKTETALHFCIFGPSFYSFSIFLSLSSTTPTLKLHVQAYYTQPPMYYKNIA